MNKTQLIGEYKQQDGWHAARTFETEREARIWVYRIEEAGGHEHARRFRRVRVGSMAWDAACDCEEAAARA